MEKRVSLEMRGRTPSQIKDLVLDNCRSTTIAGITDEFCNLEKLSLTNVGLTNLKGFPKLSNLKKLDLSDNRISGGLNNITINCPKLKSLYLSGNKIENLEAIEPLKELSNLEFLDLQTCKVTYLDNYKEKIFALLPNLKYLDGLDQNDVEAEESDVENNVKANDSADKGSDFDDDDEEDEDEDSDGEVGLDYLQKSQIDEESEGDDYSPEGEDSDVDIDESDEEESPARGEKRKLESDE